MTETKTHAGGCHCGQVRFEVNLDPSSVITCNCSICMKTGSLLAFVPADRFTLLSGGELLVDYQFGQRRIHHLFCPTCGIRSFARGTGPDGQEMCAVNVRCLDDVDIDALTIMPFDGKSL